MFIHGVLFCVFVYLFFNTHKFSDVMGIVEKSYSRNGTQSKMVPVELDYDGYVDLYYFISDIYFLDYCRDKI